jgi:ABC-type uncharacterized transport system ATPase subunit
VPLLALKGIVKRFPGCLANDRVDFEVLPGEIHALVGENGAGKSTLVKVFTGVHQVNAGEQNAINVEQRLHPAWAFLVEQFPLRLREAEVVMRVMFGDYA